jgi:hypothetical protein
MSSPSQSQSSDDSEQETQKETDNKVKQIVLDELKLLRNKRKAIFKTDLAASK